MEEDFNRDDVGVAVQGAVSVFPGVDVGFYEDRISFLGPEVGDFRGVDPHWIDVATEGGVSDIQHVRVGLLAHDQGDDFIDPFDPAGANTLDGIATKIANAINSNYNPNFPNPNPNQIVIATANGAEVSVTGAQILLPPGSPLSANGAGPGGLIRGLTAVKTVTGRTQQLFAVSDQGGLYEVDVNINDKNTLSVTTDFVTTSTADLNGVQFTGLTVGPQSVEGGRFSDILFGIDADGVVYAFNTDGELQPVFADGATTLQLDLDPLQGDPVGLIFSNLDSNLFWNEITIDDAATQINEDRRFNTQLDVYCETEDAWDTVHVSTVPCAPPDGALRLEVDKRQHDEGHGIPPSPDGTRPDYIPGHSSLHFGRGHVDNDARSYQYIGGAHGTMVSNEFSLVGKSAADKPTLYFNYFKAAGGDDSARIFISDNGGAWQMLTSLGNSGGVWDQQRIDLSNYAGIDHLRMRIDFNTGGASGLGIIDAVGDELRAIEGQYIRDGETYSIDGQVFEFESGITFVSPSGGSYVENSTLELTDENDVVTIFEFVSDVATVTPGNVPVLFAETDSAAEVADRFRTAVAAAGYDVHINNERVNIPVNRLGQGPMAVAFDVDDNLEPFLEGQSGLNVDPITGTPNNLNAITVFVHEGMSRTDVADQMNISMEPTFYEPVIITEAGSEFSDGETFVLSDGVLDPVTLLASRRVYEFDTGILIDIPTNGGQGVVDGETITFDNSATGASLTFEFDDVDINDGVAVPANIEVDYQVTDLMISFAQKLANAVNANGALMGLNAQVIDGNRVQIHSTLDTVTATSATFGIDANSVPGVGLDIEIQASGADIADGETLTLTVPGAPADTVTTFEFNLAGGVTGTNVPVNITALDTPAEIAIALGTAMTAEGFAGVNVTDHFVGLDNNAGVSGATVVAGITIRDREAIEIIPGAISPARDVAIAVRDAINLSSSAVVAGGLDVSANIGDAQRRVELTHLSLLPTAIDFTDGTGGLNLELPIGDVNNDIFKQHNDLLRVIGHTVDDAGPLGLANSLPGDTANFNEPVRFQDNDHEGFYIDDFVIGYAERGEMVTMFNGSDNYDGDPPQNPLTGEWLYATEGAYQLEIRRASEYVSGTLFQQTFDTNDRHTAGFRIIAQDGADIADGDIFTLTDGMQSINFEFNDEINSDGVTPGNFEVPFNSEMLSWEVAISIRNAINRSEVRAVLDVTAALSDGTDGTRFPDDGDGDDRDDLRFDSDPFDSNTILSSNIVDLHGDAYILGDVSLRTLIRSSNPLPNQTIYLYRRSKPVSVAHSLILSRLQVVLETIRI